MFTNDTDHLDQHFLINKEVINKYISFANFTKSDIVLEIGAGKGTLTTLVAPLVKRLYVVEIDTRLKKYLELIKNTYIIWGNVLDINLPKVDKIITSLPYSIIEPFMYKMIDTEFNEMYMLMGSHYIESVINKNVTKLSIITNAFFNIEVLLNVEPSSFDIPPRTLSYIVRITKKKNLRRIDKIYQKLFFLDNLKIKNAIMEILITLDSMTKREAKDKVNSLGIPENILDTKFAILSNEDLKILNKEIEKL